MPPLVWPRDYVSWAMHAGIALQVTDRQEDLDYQLCLLVDKASIGQAPTYIAAMLTPVSGVQSLSTQDSTTNERLRHAAYTHRKLG